MSLHYDYEDQDEPLVTNCDTCDGEIVFLKTKNGKWIPVDATSVQGYMERRFEPLDGHIAHFDTCKERMSEFASVVPEGSTNE